MALKEVCIAAHDFGPGRAKEGDIIAVRDPIGGIGKKEGNSFLWVLMDEEDLPQELPCKTSDCRACVSLDELKATDPEIDLDKVRDPQQFYQPCFDTCPKTFKHRDLRERPRRVQVRERNVKNGQLSDIRRQREH